VPTLVIDANRVISALLRDGTTRTAILSTRSTLFAPEFLLEELEVHWPELARRAGIGLEDLRSLVRPILKRIEWIPADAYIAQMAAAKEALGGVDPKDVPYLACALAVGADAIWSHDLDFDRQSLVPRVRHPDAEIR